MAFKIKTETIYPIPEDKEFYIVVRQPSFDDEIEKNLEDSDPADGPEVDATTKKLSDKKWWAGTKRLLLRCTLEVKGFPDHQGKEISDPEKFYEMLPGKQLMEVLKKFGEIRDLGLDKEDDKKKS